MPVRIRYFDLYVFLRILRIGSIVKSNYEQIGFVMMCQFLSRFVVMTHRSFIFDLVIVLFRYYVTKGDGMAKGIKRRVVKDKIDVVVNKIKDFVFTKQVLFMISYFNIILCRLPHCSSDICLILITLFWSLC